MVEHGPSLWGGILIILSLLVPVVSYRWAFFEEPGSTDVLRWMFGFTFNSHKEDVFSEITSRYFLFIFDPVGVLCTLLLLGLSIMIIIGSFKENGKPIMKWVISSFFVLLGYTLGIYLDLVILHGARSFTPTIGFFGIVFGCVLGYIGTLD